MAQIKNVLEYIRNWFAPFEEESRKRRAEDNHYGSSPKFRRTETVMGSNGFFDDNARTHNRKPVGAKPLRLIESIVLDDVPRVRRLHSSTLLNHSKATSTPNNLPRCKDIFGAMEAEDDDVKFVGSRKGVAARMAEAKKSGYNFLSTAGTVKENGAVQKAGNVLDYTFRLDEKKKYKEMLEADTSMYYTPTGKFMSKSSTSRAGKMVEMAKESPQAVSPRKQQSTKEVIMKVLGDIENEPHVIEDSEDEVAFEAPPSPKPDIKVEPVNSLKTIIYSSEVANENWLAKTVERQRLRSEINQRKLVELKGDCDSFESINKDIQRLHFQTNFKNSLRLKSTVLPLDDDDEEEDAQLPELTAAQLKVVERVFSRGSPEEKMIFKFSLNITRHDLHTLQGLNWLNDEVINFYMNLLMERGKMDRWPSVYAMNTFFYPRVVREGQSAVKRWTRKLDLFKYEMICVPIHLGMHWCMAVIHMKHKTIKYYDSMGGSNTRALEALRTYLEDEHLDKKKSSFDTSDFQLENVKDIPQQMNGSDCGMFSCTFAEFLARNAKFTFGQEDMPYLRKKMVVEIMEGRLLIQ